MRPTLLLAAALGIAVPVIAAGPAFAQVQQDSPNAANRALATEGQSRAMQQNQTGQNNINRMDIQRSQTAAPPPPGGGLPGGAAAPGGIR